MDSCIRYSRVTYIVHPLLKDLDGVFPPQWHATSRIPSASLESGAPTYSPSLGFYSTLLGLEMCACVTLFGFDVDLTDPDATYGVRPSGALLRDQGHNFTLERMWLQAAINASTPRPRLMWAHSAGAARCTKLDGSPLSARKPRRVHYDFACHKFSKRREACTVPTGRSVRRGGCAGPVGVAVGEAQRLCERINGCSRVQLSNDCLLGTLKTDRGPRLAAKSTASGEWSVGH